MDPVEFTARIGFACREMRRNEGNHARRSGGICFGTGFRTRSARPLRRPRRSRDHRLHLGHDRHVERRDADARQHRVEHPLLAARVRDAAGSDQHFVSAALPHHRPPRRFRHALPWRDAGLLSVHGPAARHACWKCVLRFLLPCRASTKRFMPRSSRRPRA